MPTEFACTIDTDGTPGVGGVDFASLATWYAALANGFESAGYLQLHPNDPIVVPGALTGTVAPGATVTQDITGVVGRLLYHNQAGQALITKSGQNALLVADDTHPWKVDGSNYWTPTGARDNAILRADCRGTTPDNSVITWNHLVAYGLTQYIEIRGNLDPTALVWDTSKYRWEVDTLTAVVLGDATNNSLILRNLQVRNSSTSTGSWTDATAALSPFAMSIRAESCLFRGGRNTVYLSSGISRVHLLNSAAYGGNKAGALNQGTKAALILQNSVAVGTTYGVRTDTNGASCLCENTYAHGGTADFSAANSGTLTLNTCASSDGTAASGTGITATGTPKTSIAHSTATFRNVSGGSEDYRLAAGSPLAYAGADLSANRRRLFADVSSADEGTNSAPLGVIAFENGSSTAVFRLYDTVNDRWFDGVSTGKRWDLSRAITLPNASTTADWFVLISDTHKGTASKSAFDAIDRLNAGTVGNWAAPTDHGWTNGTKPCAGRLKWVLVLGDLCFTDENRYGTALDDYQDLCRNTSGEGGHTGVTSIAADHFWQITGNHDDTDLMAPWNATNPGNPGFESFRFNQHGRGTNQDGVAYSDPDELRYWFEVGNNRFLMLSLLGSGDIAHATNSGHGSLGPWNAADTAWAANALASHPPSKNLLVMVHAPMLQANRWGKGDQYMGTAVECALAAAPWVFSANGHTHAFDLKGPDIGSVGARTDAPTRGVWDIGADESPAQPRRPVRNIRALGGPFALKT